MTVPQGSSRSPKNKGKRLANLIIFSLPPPQKRKKAVKEKILICLLQTSYLNLWRKMGRLF